MRIICSLRQILMCEMLSFRSIFADYVNYSFVQNYIFLTKKLPLLPKLRGEEV